MSVCERAGFLSPNRISGLDSESKKVGASSDSIIYLGNRILCIRQPLKYLCFSYSPLNGLSKYQVETLNSSSLKIHWKWWHKTVDWNSTQQSLVSLGSWQRCSQNIVCELRVVWRKKLLRERERERERERTQVCESWSWNSLGIHCVRNRNGSKINWKL